MKHVTYFQNFLSNEVDLNKTRLDRLNYSLDNLIGLGLLKS